MLAVFINAGGIIAGSLIGLAYGRVIPKRIGDTIMSGIGMFSLIIGISGAMGGGNTLVMLISLVLGVIVGEIIDIDKWLNRIGQFAERMTQKEGSEKSVATAFVSSSLLMCIGAMSIVGSLEAGLHGNMNILLTKTVLDTISAVFFAMSLGFGVMFTAVTVIVLQGGVVLFSQALAPILTEAMITEMSCTGSVMIAMLGLNILGVTKIKTANFLPAIAFAPFVLLLVSRLPI